MRNPTLVVLTDRNDLDDQLFGQFQRCHELLRQMPVQAALAEFIDMGHFASALRRARQSYAQRRASLLAALLALIVGKVSDQYSKRVLIKLGAFFGALDKQGFEVKAKDLQVFAGGAKKADWDVGIAVDAIKLSDKLDVIVLVTGDGDYIPLVEYLQNTKGCLVEILAFQKTCSSRLVEAADDFIDLGEYKKYLK